MRSIVKRCSLAGLVLVLPLTIFAGGCNLFGPRNTPQTPPTRPSPTRPTGRRTGDITGPADNRTGDVRPSPTKRLPGVSATGLASLRASANRCMDAVSKNNWAEATKQANKLGVDWTRFKPQKTGTMSATEMTKFDTTYARLQKNVRGRNKAGCQRDLRALIDTINKMRT